MQTLPAVGTESWQSNTPDLPRHGMMLCRECSRGRSPACERNELGWYRRHCHSDSRLLRAQAALASAYPGGPLEKRGRPPPAFPKESALPFQFQRAVGPDHSSLEASPLRPTLHLGVNRPTRRSLCLLPAMASSRRFESDATPVTFSPVGISCRLLAVGSCSLRLALWDAFGYTAVPMAGETGTLAPGDSSGGDRSCRRRVVICRG